MDCRLCLKSSSCQYKTYLAMRRLLFLLLFVFPLFSFAHSVSGKYKLIYLCYKNDTVEVLDTSSVKRVVLKIIKDSKALDSAAFDKELMDSFLFCLKTFVNLTLRMESDGKYHLSGYIDNSKVTIDFSNEELVSLFNLRGHQIVSITQQGVTYLFELLQ